MKKRDVERKRFKRMLGENREREREDRVDWYIKRVIKKAIRERERESESERVSERWYQDE